MRQNPPGRLKYKATKPRNKPRSPLSSSSVSSANMQLEGETKQYERKRFFPNDHKFKRSSEIVHVRVKILEKVMNEGGDPVPTLKHLKFILDKLSKGCFNYDAISGYDEAVRSRVALKGYLQFAKI